MTCDLEPATPGRVFRVGKGPDPWAYPEWAQAGEDGTFGNHWDDPRSSYRVLYACSQRLGALIENLSRFRPDPEVVAGLAAIEGEEPSPIASRISAIAISPFPGPLDLACPGTFLSTTPPRALREAP